LALVVGFGINFSGVVVLKKRKCLAGTAWNARAERWQARIYVDGSRKHLGYFDTEQAAHVAYVTARDVAGPALRGKRSTMIPKDVGLEDKKRLLPVDFFERIYYGGVFWETILEQCARVSVRLNISAFNVGYLIFCPSSTALDPDKDIARYAYATDDDVARYATMLDKLDLWDALPDIASMCVAGDGMTFEQAVTDVMGIA
jgi:hypothetical protein